MHDSIQIRRAKPEDATSVAYYIFLAMEDIACRFIGEKSAEKALRWLEGLVGEKRLAGKNLEHLQLSP